MSKYGVSSALNPIKRGGALVMGNTRSVRRRADNSLRLALKVERLRRYGSRRTKVVARRASHLPVAEVLKAVVASRRQSAWVKRFMAYLTNKGFPSGLARYLAYGSFENAGEALDDMTPEEWAQEELYAMAT